MKSDRMAIIYPVILPVPASGRALSGRERTKLLSALARDALSESAKKSGVFIDRLDKDDRGAPLPFGDIHWSLSHKETYVAAVVAQGPVGIDIERVKPCSDALYRKTGSDEEWALGGAEPDDHLFFRYWTAKEAVLKTTGAGFSEFSQCRVRQVVDEKRLLLFYRDREWRVEHFYFDGHLAAVVKDGWDVCWEVVESEE
jgi:4'-phosphopantetheinyl transferase